MLLTALKMGIWVCRKGDLRETETRESTVTVGGMAGASKAK